MNVKLQGKDGDEIVPHMGSYGIGITRTPQAALEKYYDDKVGLPAMEERLKKLEKKKK